MMANTVRSKLLHFLMPKALVNIQKELAAKSAKYNLTVQNYEQLSNDLKTEIDKNHFSPYLRYEKVLPNGSNESS